jgi:hypothetical protein
VLNDAGNPVDADTERLHPGGPIEADARRLKAWTKAGLITRRGDAITVDAPVTLAKAEPITRPVTPRARVTPARTGPVTPLAGPGARYLAALLGVPDENVMRWFILVVALLLDPAAVLLLLAATHD